ncbi:MAG: ATP-dependent Clp protease ATP-binding subunit [Oscillospiraceae bacterium]|jgi:ATP-dependent Clp protease ATP-binding subunit ClpA|nr:ATP-dependent Clp protease ATP-binding subunit [Oscillospiraceae bacterium]
MPPVCSRCKKNPPVIIFTDQSHNQVQGLCFKCARELKLEPFEDILKKTGITDEDLDNISQEIMGMFSGEENALAEIDDSDEGRTTTFPFIDRLFSAPQDKTQQPPAAPPAPRDRAPGPWGLPFNQPEPPEREREGGRGENRGKKKFLESYCISLTGRAKNGKLDRMVGRESETERVVQILNRRQKNNPCLIGEPGVGKTAIAEGLAQRISDGTVPYKLQGREVYMLDLTSLVAGTQFRGQFESRMKGLIDEVKSLGNIILVIDEVHNLVGAGDAEGSMNAANILKPALSRGEIQVIGATTFNEYRKHIEKDSALERRFQPVTVAEPSIAEATEILLGIKHYYEEHHGVTIPDEIAKKAVTLSERYITDRFLPDKAIDLIDEACSDLNLKDETIIRRDKIRREQAGLSRDRDALLSLPSDKMDYEKLAGIRSREQRLAGELTELDALGAPALTVDSLARVIELWTKIPAASIQEDEYARLKELDARLKAHIVGQDEAVDLVCNAIRRNRIGISAKHKPSSFIFIGSTGVGKTELVKRLAEDLFDNPEALIRLDMSEFMEKHTVSRIIGSPPGYVGYDEAGQLTEKIRRRPYSVILFDEIEKAHPDVMNILLQILDDGRLTDAHGKVVNFENTVIIMTTNAGSDRRDVHLGFNRSQFDAEREKNEKALKEFLRPEFMNRVDEVVYFNRLTEENFTAIAKLMLDELRLAMADRGTVLTYDDSVLAYLTKQSFSEVYGARNLRRAIQKDIEDAIAGEIIEHLGRNVSRVGIHAEDDKLQIVAI